MPVVYCTPLTIPLYLYEAPHMRHSLRFLKTLLLVLAILFVIAVYTFIIIRGALDEVSLRENAHVVAVGD